MANKEQKLKISYADFIKGNFKGSRNEFNEHPVLLFLKKNKSAYTARAISKEVKMGEESVRSILRTLIEKKIVIHKQPYFAYKR